MNLNRFQSVIFSLMIIILATLVLFPPWRQAAKNEVSYRKDIGHAYLFRPPTPVAVDCYFVGCKSAPPSYFHVLLYRELLSEQLATVLVVSVIAIWLFRTRADGSKASLTSPRTRLGASVLLALLVPPTGDFPLASDLFDIPRQIVHRDELWLIPLLLTLLMFAALVLVFYLLITLSLRASVKFGIESGQRSG